MIKDKLQPITRNPFLPSFLIGAILIVLIRLAFPGNGGTITAILIAVSTIILLGLYYYRSGVKDLIRAGDELYYLGLLFTLISLCYALVSLFILSPEGNLEQRTYELIGSFGIALVSTVVGILARILLQGVDDGPTDSGEASSDTDVEGLTSHYDSSDLLALRQELREATDAFSHFTRMTLNQAEQTAVHSERLIKEFNERMSASSRRSLEETAASWGDVVQEIRSQGEQAMGQITEVVQHTLERTENNWRTLAERVEATSQNAQTQLEANVSAMSKMLEYMNSTNRSLDTLATSLETTEQHVSTLGKTAANAATGLDDRATEIIKTHEVLVQGTQQRHEAVQRGIEDAQHLMSKMLEHMDSTNRSLDTLATSLETTEQHVGTLGKTAANTVNGLDDRSTEIIKAHEVLIKDAQQRQEAVQRSMEEAQRLMSKMLEHMDSTNRSFNTLAISLETTEQHVSTLGKTAANIASGLDGRVTGVIKAHDVLIQDTQQQHGAVQHGVEEAQPLSELVADQTLKSSSPTEGMQTKSLWWRWRKN